MLKTDKNRIRRDDFNIKTKELLAKRVAYKCSNPKCRKQTIGPKEGDEGTVNIGEAAHICAASQGGKRYDEKMTTAMRGSYDNGIWLCKDCAALIDRDEKKYTVELLHQWKNDAEFEALSAITGKKKNTENNKLTTEERNVLDTIIQVMENVDTQYMLLVHDYQNEFDRNKLEDLFELYSHLQRPSIIGTITNNEMRNAVEKLTESIKELWAMIALGGGVSQIEVSKNMYVIDCSTDQVKINEQCDRVWEHYQRVLGIMS